MDTGWEEAGASRESGIDMRYTMCEMHSWWGLAVEHRSSAQCELCDLEVWDGARGGRL